MFGINSQLTVRILRLKAVVLHLFNGISRINGSIVPDIARKRPPVVAKTPTAIRIKALANSAVSAAKVEIHTR